jgi:hypothetical protein
MLLEYLWDLEVERWTWYKADGITGVWFSTPLEPESSNTVTAIPTEGKPATNQPYPEPNKSTLSAT